MEPTAMSTLLTGFTDFCTTVIGVIGDVVTEVVAQPLLLIGVFAGLLFMGVGLIKKFV